MSTICPPCVRCGRCVRLIVCLDRASKSCPPCVRLVGPCPCPPSVRCGRAGASKPCPPSCALASPPNLGRHASVRPCARLALYPPYVIFGRASNRCVSHVALCVRHVSATCVCFVLLLFALYPLFVGFWPGLWFGFGRAGLCQLCVRSLVFAPLSVLCPLLVGRSRVEVFVATPLPAVRLPAVLLSALKFRRAFAPCPSFSPFVRFCVCIVCLEFVCVCPCPNLYTKLGRCLCVALGRALAVLLWASGDACRMRFCYFP